MYRPGSKATLSDVYEFLAKAMNEVQVPEPLRKGAAALLRDTGWASMLGVEDAAIKLLDVEPPESTATSLYDESADVIGDRV
jgi:hypothetical protein